MGYQAVQMGMESCAEKYAGEDMAEMTVTIRLPRSVFEKTMSVAEWRKMPLARSIEHDLFMLATHQAKRLSECLEERK